MQSDIFCFLLVSYCGDPGAGTLHPRLPSVFGVVDVGGVDDDDEGGDVGDDDDDDDWLRSWSRCFRFCSCS